MLLKDGGASQTIPSRRHQLQRATMQRHVRLCFRRAGQRTSVEVAFAPRPEIAGHEAAIAVSAYNELAADKEFNAVARKPQSAAPLPKSHKSQEEMGGVRSSRKPDFRTRLVLGKTI